MNRTLQEATVSPIGTNFLVFTGICLSPLVSVPGVEERNVSSGKPVAFGE